VTLNALRVRSPGPRPRSRTVARRQRRTARWALPATAASAFAFGALLEFFVDPRSGRRRRRSVSDRTLSRLRRTERRATRRARRAESHAVGIVRRTLNTRRPKEPLDDVTLAHKVESELFRRARVPKGGIDVNAEEGVVFLRGVVEREGDIAGIEAAARRITGVRGVENLLHMPGTPAPASRPKLIRERART